MTPEEAIKSLENLEQHHVIHGWSASRDALKQGIEALKRCRHNYLNPQRADFRRLPGETEGET